MNPKYAHIGHIFDCTAEECAEVIQALSKIRRFGMFAYNPEDPNEVPNYIKLLAEIKDCQYRLMQLEQYLLEEPKNENNA